MVFSTILVCFSLCALHQAVLHPQGTRTRPHVPAGGRSLGTPGRTGGRTSNSNDTGFSRFLYRRQSFHKLNIKIHSRVYNPVSSTAQCWRRACGFSGNSPRFQHWRHQPRGTLAQPRRMPRLKPTAKNPLKTRTVLEADWCFPMKLMDLFSLSPLGGKKRRKRLQPWRCGAQQPPRQQLSGFNQSL